MPGAELVDHGQKSSGFHPRGGLLERSVGVCTAYMCAKRPAAPGTANTNDAQGQRSVNRNALAQTNAGNHARYLDSGRNRKFKTSGKGRDAPHAQPCSEEGV